MANSELEEFEFRARAEAESKPKPEVKAAPVAPKALPKSTSLLENVASPYVGGAEAVANLASSMVAKPMSDLAGLGGVLAGVTGLRKNADPEAERESVRRAMTYQPRTSMGKNMAEYNPLALAGEYVINPVTEGLGEVASYASDDAGTRRVIKSGVTEAAQQGLGFLGAKGLGPRAVKAPKVHTSDVVRRTALDSGKALGLDAAPTEYGAGKFKRQMEGIAGSSEIKTDYAISNRPKINAAAREQAGMAPETPLTAANFKAARASHAAPYRQASNLGTVQLATPPPSVIKAQSHTTTTGVGVNPKTTTVHTLDAGDAVEQVKQFRRDSNMIERSPIGSANPEQMASAREMRKAADYLEKAIEDHATAIGQADLVPKLRESRSKIAQLRSLENATIGGDIHANLLSRQLEHGVKLSGHAKTIAEFEQQVKGSMKHPTVIGTPPVDVRNMLISALRVAAKPVARQIVLGKRPKIFRTPTSAAAVVEALRNKEQQDAT